MRGLVVGGDGLEVVKVELIEMNEQFRQITVQILINLLKQLTEFERDFLREIPMQEM